MYTYTYIYIYERRPIFIEKKSTMDRPSRFKAVVLVLSHEIVMAYLRCCDAPPLPVEICPSNALRADNHRDSGKAKAEMSWERAGPCCNQLNRGTASSECDCARRWQGGRGIA